MASSHPKQLIVIGAGPGGYAAAFRAADLGLKVTLIDPEAHPGGVCLYRGCIPSKALLHLVKTKQDSEEAADWGIDFDKPKIDVGKIRSRKEEIVKKLTAGVGQLAKSRKVEYIRGMAHFESENKIRVEPESGEAYTLEFENLILATGSVPASLPDIKPDHKLILDSSDALDLPGIPKSLLVIGGGYIGLEMGSVYAGLGSEVTFVELTSGFLPGVSRSLVKVFEKAHPFAKTFFDTRISALKTGSNSVLATLKHKDDTEEEIEFDKALLAVGRKPNTGNLDLKKAGIKTDDNGFIRVDKKLYSGVGNIYAIGDITGEPMLAHKASHQGRVAAEVISGDRSAAWDVKAIPAIVFTHPQIAWCGLTEKEAKEKGIPIRKLRFPWQASGRAIAIGKPSGLTELLVDSDNGRILGGGVAGANAGSLIPEIALAVEMGATAADLALTIHPHPTLSETIMEAAEIFEGGATHIFKG